MLVVARSDELAFERLQGELLLARGRLAVLVLDALRFQDHLEFLAGQAGGNHRHAHRELVLGVGHLGRLQVLDLDAHGLAIFAHAHGEDGDLAFGVVDPRLQLLDGIGAAQVALAVGYDDDGLHEAAGFQFDDLQGRAAHVGAPLEAVEKIVELGAKFDLVLQGHGFPRR